MAETTAPTCFAPGERATPEEIDRLVKVVGESELTHVLLESVGSALFVLDEHRQIVSTNRGVMDALGIERREALYGLRPGEALRCLNLTDAPNGCGTSKACSTCGSVISILAAQETGQVNTRECLLTAHTDDGDVCYEFEARATPLVIEGQTVTVVVLRDISSEKRRQALERVFFHDLMNVVGGITGWSQTLEMLQESQVREAAGRIVALSERLTQEVEQHRALVLAEQGELGMLAAEYAPRLVLESLQLVFSGHPSVAGRNLSIELPDATEPTVHTDVRLLERVLVNMVKNALEATPVGGTVVVQYERVGDRPTYSVWNPGGIPEPVALQIFRRSFSTKGQPGRGLGTYSMKLFGEGYLGGEVGFTSTEAEGTTFSIALPPSGPPPRH